MGMGLELNLSRLLLALKIILRQVLITLLRLELLSLFSFFALCKLYLKSFLSDQIHPAAAFLSLS
jgi:hypothetical protein